MPNAMQIYIHDDLKPMIPSELVDRYVVSNDGTWITRLSWTSSGEFELTWLMTEKDFAAFKYVIDKEHVDNRVMEILKLKERPHVYSINVSMKTGDRTPNHPSNYVTVKGATSEGSSQSVITLSQALDALYALTKENTRDGLRPMMIYVEAAKHQHEWSKLDEFLRALDTTRLHAIALMGVARCTYSARNVLSEWTAYLERAYAEAQRRFPDQADSLFVGLIP